MQDATYAKMQVPSDPATGPEAALGSLIVETLSDGSLIIETLSDGCLIVGTLSDGSLIVGILSED